MKLTLQFPPIRATVQAKGSENLEYTFSFEYPSINPAVNNPDASCGNLPKPRSWKGSVTY